MRGKSIEIDIVVIINHMKHIIIGSIEIDIVKYSIRKTTFNIEIDIVVIINHMKYIIIG